MDESDLRELRLPPGHRLEVLETRFYGNFWDAYLTHGERIETLFRDHNVTGFNHNSLFFKTPEDITYFVLRWS